MSKSGKHCGKRRNCSFWAISSFVTMFLKIRLLQRRQKASIWGKGLNKKHAYVHKLAKGCGILKMGDFLSLLSHLKVVGNLTSLFWTETLLISNIDCVCCLYLALLWKVTNKCSSSLQLVNHYLWFEHK